MTILFRCNAGQEIGIGHLMRCRALAQALRECGERCIMVGPARTYAAGKDQEIFSDWITNTEWQSTCDDANQLLKLTKDKNASFVVLDDYRVDEKYQLVLLESGLRWLQFDGTARMPLWADLILNSSPMACAEDYHLIKRNQNAGMLLGPRYAILRSEFRDITARTYTRPIQRILVTFGGGDDQGAIEYVLSTLVKHTTSEVEFVVVSGKNNPRNNQLVKWVENNGQNRIEIEIDPANVAKVYASCDLALMAGGGSTYEMACCGVPMILIAIADNQIKHGMAWEKAGAAMFLGSLKELNDTRLISYFNQMHDSSQKRAKLCIAARSICDGLGARRVTTAILDQLK